jgi:hypothetical protein
MDIILVLLVQVKELIGIYKMVAERNDSSLCSNMGTEVKNHGWNWVYLRT